jgi:hypothetical protein
MTDTNDDSLGEAVSLIDRAGEQVPRTLEKMFARGVQKPRPWALSSEDPGSGTIGQWPCPSSTS